MTAAGVARALRRGATALAVAGAVSGAAGCERSIASGQADGRAIFMEVCARCHGPRGTPTPADVARLGVKDLADPKLQDQLSDDRIRRQILRGSDNQNMPAFEGALTDDQIAAVIRYVRSLRRSPAR